MNSSTSGYSPAYLNEYRGHRLVAVATAFLVLDIIFVTLRFGSRYVQGRRLKADDWLMIPSLIFCVGGIATAFVAVNYGGVGRHIQYTKQHPDMYRVWYQTCTIATAVLYIFAAALPKLAILALFLQVFVDKRQRWATYGTMAAIIINVCVMVPLEIWKCSPISYGWRIQLDPGLKGGSCAAVEPRIRWASLANIITDIALILLPIPTLRMVAVGRATKIGLALTFGMAAAGLVASCMRFAAYFKVKGWTVNTTNTIDSTWNAVTLVSWCIVEPGIYVFVACQMTFRPLVVALVQSPSGAWLSNMFAACETPGGPPVETPATKTIQDDTASESDNALCNIVSQASTLVDSDRNEQIPDLPLPPDDVRNLDVLAPDRA